MRLPGVTVSREGAALGLPGEGVAPGCGRGSRLRAGLRPRRCGGGRGRVCVCARAPVAWMCVFCIRFAVRMVPYLSGSGKAKEK